MSTGFPGTLRTSPSIGRSNSNRNELSRCLPRLCVASAPKRLTRQTPPEAGTMRILIAGGQGQLGRAVEAALAGHDLWAPGHSQLDGNHRKQVPEGHERREPGHGNPSATL